MKKPSGRKKIPVINCYSQSLYLILCFLSILLILVSGQQQNSSSSEATVAPATFLQTSSLATDWLQTEPPQPETSANTSSTSSPATQQQSIKSVVMETAKPLESQHLSQLISADEYQADNSSSGHAKENVIQASTRRPSQSYVDGRHQNRIASVYQASPQLHHQHYQQLLAPVNTPPGQQYNLERRPALRNNYATTSGELEELPMELLHEHDSTGSADKLLSQLASLSLNQPRLVRSNVKNQLTKSTFEVSEPVGELSVSEPQSSLSNELQSSLKPKHVEPPNVDSTPVELESLPESEPSIDWSQMSQMQALLQADAGPEYNFGPASGPLLMQHVPAASSYKHQVSQPLSRQPGKSLRQFASKFLKSPTSGQTSLMYNRSPAMMSTASRFIPKSIKSLFEPLTTAGTRLAPLVSGGRRPKQLFSGQESSDHQGKQQATSAASQMPPLSLVLVNGQLYSVLNHNQPSSTEASGGNFDHQTSDTSEFPVFEAQSSNSHSGSSSSIHNRGCNSPRHIIHADRSVVNHILESQQNFVIARVPIKKYPAASSPNIWGNSIEQQLQQQQQLLSASQNNLYHAFPMQTLASSSPVVSAPTNIGFRPPAVSIEVQASSPRPSIWQSFANFVSSLTRPRRPSYTYMNEASNQVYSLDLPGSLYLGGGGRRWWHRRARRLDPLLMNAFRMLGSEPRYLDVAQNRRTSSTTMDPMQRLLMLKTAYENEVCSPVAEVADKIKYSCLPNHCVASALASAAINLEHQQSMRHQSSALNLNDANSMLDYYLSHAPAHVSSATHPYVSSQSVLTNNYTTANIEHNSPIEVLQLDDSMPSQLPIVTYTHMNAYEAPASSRLAQPQHQHFTGGSKNLETFAELDEAEQPALIHNGAGLAQRHSMHLVDGDSNAQVRITGRRRQPHASNSFYQIVPRHSFVTERPSVSLGTIYQSSRRSPTSLRSGRSTTTQAPQYREQLDWSNFASVAPPVTPTTTEAMPRRLATMASVSSDNAPKRNRKQLKTRHWAEDSSSGGVNNDNDENELGQPTDDNEEYPKRVRNSPSNSTQEQQPKQTISTAKPSTTTDDELRARKTRRSRPQQQWALPRYGLRKASLPPPERELDSETDEGSEQPWLRPGEEEDSLGNTTDCNCDKTSASPNMDVPINAGSDQLDKWRRATLGALNQRDSQHPVNRSTIDSELLEQSWPHQQMPTMDKRQQVARFQNRSQYNLRNTTYRNLQLAGPLPAMQDLTRPNTVNSTRAPRNSIHETFSTPSDISTTTASSSTWNAADNLSLEPSSAQTNLLKLAPEQQRPTLSTSPSIDQELQMIRELEEPDERLSRLGTGRPRIGGFNFKPLSVNEIIAQARRENQRSNITAPSVGPEASASVAQNTSGSRLKEEKEEDEEDGIVPHQYQIQIRTNVQQPLVVDESGSQQVSSSVVPSQELALDKMKERVKDRLFEHREEEHWHEKKWLKGRKRRRLVDGKWVLENLPGGTDDIENPIKLKEASVQEKHFTIPTPNFGHSSKFLDWVQRDVDMNEEPGEPTSHNQRTETSY